MFFMKFPIDVVFLNRDEEVVHLTRGIAPWSVSKWVPSAHSAVECAAGRIESFGLKIGDGLEFIPVGSKQ